MVNSPDDNIIFKFEFMSMYCKNKNLSNKVYSTNRGDMELFLRQHGFDLGLAQIQCMTVDEYMKDSDDRCQEHLLRPTMFKSNKSPELFTILTTYDILYSACETVCSMLSENLLFGHIVLKTDIELIKVINDLVNELPHVFILDHAYVDSDSGEIIGDRKYLKSNRPLDSFDFTDEGYDDSFIYESIFNSMVDDDIQPITLEAYVSYFTSLLTDKYD